MCQYTIFPANLQESVVLFLKAEGLQGSLKDRGHLEDSLMNQMNRIRIILIYAAFTKWLKNALRLD